jgi:hypothetical protein
LEVHTFFKTRQYFRLAQIIHAEWMNHEFSMSKIIRALGAEVAAVNQVEGIDASVVFVADIDRWFGGLFLLFFGTAFLAFPAALVLIII